MLHKNPYNLVLVAFIQITYFYDFTFQSYEEANEDRRHAFFKPRIAG